MYTFLLTYQIYNNNKIKRNNTKDTTLKHILVFPFIKNKAFWILAERIEQKSLNEWKKTTNKQTNIKWMYSLFVYLETRGSVIW